MFIYIPRHLNKLEIVSQMTNLLQEYVKTYGSSNTRDSFDYYYYYYTLDPVKNFIRMCLTRDNKVVDEGVQWYLIHLFYSVKGTPKVLELMETILGLEFIPDKYGNKFIYDENSISYNLKEISTFNIKSFMEAQEKFLSSLLYYYDITTIIDKAKLIVEEELSSNVSILNWTYTHYEVGNN